MELGSTARRRWFGGIVLFGALGMLICGQTLLKDRLSGGAYLIYWLICFGFTGLAIIAAFLDVRALQRRIREEHRELLEATLKRIETEAKGAMKSDPPPSKALRRTGDRNSKTEGKPK